MINIISSRQMGVICISAPPKIGRLVKRSITFVIYKPSLLPEITCELVDLHQFQNRVTLQDEHHITRQPDSRVVV